MQPVGAAVAAVSVAAVPVPAAAAVAVAAAAAVAAVAAVVVRMQRRSHDQHIRGVGLYSCQYAATKKNKVNHS